MPARWLQPVRHQPRPDPLALRGRLGASFARSLGGLAIPLNGLRSKAHSCPEICGDPYKSERSRPLCRSAAIKRGRALGDWARLDNDLRRRRGRQTRVRLPRGAARGIADRAPYRRSHSRRHTGSSPAADRRGVGAAAAHRRCAQRHVIRALRHRARPCAGRPTGERFWCFLHGHHRRRGIITRSIRTVQRCDRPHPGAAACRRHCSANSPPGMETDAPAQRGRARPQIANCKRSSLTKNTARVAARVNDDVADPEVVMSTRLTAADVTICACEEDHVAAITTIYTHHVLHGLASFEIEPPREDDMQRRLDIVSRNYPYLVAECDREVVGYAYASPYRLRPAYRHTAENSVYLHPAWTGRGIGRQLMSALLAECEE